MPSVSHFEILILPMTFWDNFSLSEKICWDMADSEPTSYDKLSTVSVKEAKRGGRGDFLRQFASFDRGGTRSANAPPNEPELRRFVGLCAAGHLFVAGAGIVILSVLGKRRRVCIVIVCLFHCMSTTLSACLDLPRFRYCLFICRCIKLSVPDWFFLFPGMSTWTSSTPWRVFRRCLLN